MIRTEVVRGQNNEGCYNWARKEEKFVKLKGRALMRWAVWNATNDQNSEAICLFDEV